MKTRRIARSGERTFSKSGRSERNLPANLEEYENDVLDQEPMSRLLTRPTTVAVLGIQKFSNFALYVISK